MAVEGGLAPPLRGLTGRCATLTLPHNKLVLREGLAPP